MYITPNEWGPNGWKFIHHIAWGFPRNPTDIDIENYKNFFTMLEKVLPCCGCKQHYSENLLLYPLTNDVFTSYITLMKWTIDMHNETNKLNNKKIYTYEEGIQLIENNFIG